MSGRGHGGRAGDDPRGRSSGAPGNGTGPEADPSGLAAALPLAGDALTAPEAGPESEVMGLVRESQRGNREAFGALYDRYHREVFRFVWNRTKSYALAEDLTSETFLRAWKRRDSFSWQGRDYAAWLMTIARNLVVDHFKSSAARREIASENMLEHDSAEDGPENAVVRAMTGQVVQDALATLKPEHRECIELRFLKGLSLDETARHLGKKVNAVKALQLRAVTALGRVLPDGLR